MVNPNISNSVKRLWENPEYRERMRKAHLGQNAWNRGIPMSDEQKKRISSTLKGSVSPNKGKTFSVEACNNMSLAHKGKPSGIKGKKMSFVGRANVSIGSKGKVLSDVHKTKIRIATCKRIQSLGIAPRIDKGATSFFNMLNTVGYHICHPNIYVDDLGYFVDGYDPFKHIVYEYDTPVHLRPGRHDKDVVRQTNIITHFASNGNPLNGFIRINDTGIGNNIMVDVMEENN
jgi:hypothetical protein